MNDFERAEKILTESGYFENNPGSPGGNCPVQHTAQLKDGRSYSFRSRGSVAAIEIYPEWAEWRDDMLPEERPEGQYETSYRWPHAGWISPVKAARLIVKWLSFFTAIQCGDMTKRSELPDERSSRRMAVLNRQQMKTLS